MPELIQMVAGIAEKLTVMVILVVIIVTGYKGVWVWGRQLDKCQQESDRWREMALKGNYMTERTVQLAETVAAKVPKENVNG